MKKYLFYLPLFCLIFIACSTPNDEKIIIKNEIKKENEIQEIEEVKSDAITSKLPEEQDLSDLKKTQFNLTLEHAIDSKKNNIYCVTMLYAWNEIRTALANKVTINKGLEDLTLLNNSTSFIDVLKQNEYTVNTEITEFEIKAKAEFSKTLPFPIQFETDFDIDFNGQMVAAFGCKGPGYEFQKQMKILYYENNDHFVVQLKPKEKGHVILLYKTNKTFSSMSAYLEELNKDIEFGKQEINANKNMKNYYFDYFDVLKIPKFSFKPVG